jgi:hypothetical protein
LHAVPDVKDAIARMMERDKTHVDILGVGYNGREKKDQG